MISRRHRFHGYGSLKYVYSHGNTVRGPLFAIRVVPNPKRNNYRLAVVVSRKVHKSAVGRNKIRRRLYETVRGFEGSMNKPYDIVLTVFQDEVLQTKPNELKQQVKKQLQQAKILN